MTQSIHSKERKHLSQTPSKNERRRVRSGRLASYLIAIAAGAVLSAAVITARGRPLSGQSIESVRHEFLPAIGRADSHDNQQLAQQLQVPQSLGELLALDDNQIAQCDFALLNLLCAQGLPGAEHLDVNVALATLDQWATHVRSETARQLYRFRDHPEQYNNSEAYFQTLMLIVVLQEDFKVHYNPERILEPDYTNARDLFIHGMIGDDNGGTCVSMPALYVAVGQRLEYPLELVVTKGHVFARWDDGTPQGERFNIEATNRGLRTPTDEYYMTWPYQLTEAERSNGWLLESLTSSEAMAVFLMQRGHCLLDTGQLNDAQVAYALAHRLAPQAPDALYFLAQAVAKEIPSLRGARPTNRPLQRRGPRTRDERAEWYQSVQDHQKSVIQPNAMPATPLRSIGGGRSGSGT